MFDWIRNLFSTKPSILADKKKDAFAQEIISKKHDKREMTSILARDFEERYNKKSGNGAASSPVSSS